MASADVLRQRRVDSLLGGVGDEQRGGDTTAANSNSHHDVTSVQQSPGPVRHNWQMQVLRMLLFLLYFTLGIFCIFVSQLLVLPFYFYNQDYYYACMAITKQFFGILITVMTQWWSPTTVRISGDESVKGQLRQRRDGTLKCKFPERMVLIANHQIYTDWIYLWWIAYTGRMHGHIYIILKESLKYLPIVGQGMIFFSFIFLSRKWANDKPRFQHRLRKLNSRHGGPMAGNDPKALDPMWLLIYPEGTNLSHNGRAASSRWAAKQGIEDMRHVLLPRSTGLLFCLQELKETVDYVYDCTVAYEGIPRGEYGQDIFTLFSTYFQGRRPKSVNMHFRRFHISTIPASDEDPVAFEMWLRERWREKDDLMEYYLQHGRFPADPESVVIESGGGQGARSQEDLKSERWIETEVKPRNDLEVLQLLAPSALLWLVMRNVLKVWRWATWDE